jgi:hypothetical protein
LLKSWKLTVPDCTEREASDPVDEGGADEGWLDYPAAYLPNPDGFRGEQSSAK